MALLIYAACVMSCVALCATFIILQTYRMMDDIRARPRLAQSSVSYDKEDAESVPLRELAVPISTREAKQRYRNPSVQIDGSDNEDDYYRPQSADRVDIAGPNTHKLPT